ncbi:helix-turn-helix domain-containing protein [Paenibacillus sp. y28]|uniref:helix-turn-helix domain-containing protein n=1 Tax=Paenibacillus sp. y28 TaxID=3129110 RepID=UPI00301868E1
MKKTVGTRIRQEREKREWSQLELAAKIGINNSVLSRIEANKRPVEDVLLVKFADLFEVSTDYLTGRIENVKHRQIYDGTLKFLETIELSEETAIQSIVESFSYKGNDISEEEARTIYYLALGVLNKNR